MYFYKKSKMKIFKRTRFNVTLLFSSLLCIGEYASYVRIMIFFQYDFYQQSRSNHISYLSLEAKYLVIIHGKGSGKKVSLGWGGRGCTNNRKLLSMGLHRSKKLSIWLKNWKIPMWKHFVKA